MDSPTILPPYGASALICHFAPKRTTSEGKAASLLPSCFLKLNIPIFKLFPSFTYVIHHPWKVFGSLTLFWKKWSFVWKCQEEPRADVQMCASVRRVHRVREMSQVESSQSCRGLLSIEHAVKETKSEEIQTKAVTSKVRPEKWNVRPCTTSNLANRYVCWRPPSLKEKCGFFRSIGQRRTWKRGRARVCGMFVLHWLSAPVTEFSPSPSVCLYTRPFFSLYHFQPRYSPFP